MKKLLIIYPHWIPCNMVGVQRSRLIANFLEEHGWHPIILTVNPRFYQKDLVPELSKLVKPHVEVHYVNAIPEKKIPFIGDMALRAFGHLKNKAIELIREQNIDFLWLPIPSCYNALLGRPIHKATGVPYGIDYIDPWVNGFPGQEKLFSKAWLSNQLSKILEPYAVKKASLISGVAYNYYAPVLKRYFKNKTIEHCAMQYGFDPFDYTLKPDKYDKPWDSAENIKPLIYAGAFLPKSHLFLNLLFKSISQLRAENKLDIKIRLYFIGTGPYQEKRITEYAKEHGIDDIVSEQRERRSYLQILDLLKQAYGVMVLGSTEKHYTASKTFQALLSKNPVFAILHEQSSACSVISEAGSDAYLVKYNPRNPEEQLKREIKTKFLKFITSPGIANLDMDKLGKYSAKASTQKLVNILEKV